MALTCIDSRGLADDQREQAVRRGAWAAVLAVVVLAGCSEPGQPSTTLPTATSTSAAEPTLEPLGPADFPVPAEAREQTLDGALAMAGYYFDLIDYAQAIPAGEWIREFADGCETCSQLADSRDDDAANGVRLVGGDLSVSSSSGMLTDGTAEVAYVVDQQPLQVFGPDGAELVDRGTDGGQLTGGGFLRWDDTRSVWVTTQIDLSRS